MEKYIGVTAQLYEDLIDSGKHILIAGMTGSGKSVIMNGMINAIILRDAAKHKTVLCDVKMVEFGPYDNTKHCIVCATTIEAVERTLTGVIQTIKTRLAYMKDHNLKMYDGSTIHLFVDELADIILTSKSATKSLQRICQLGRAARIQVICATQCPLASVIPTRIKVNFPIVVGLHTQTAQHSRNIIEENGCEDLPEYGKALIKYPTIGVKEEIIPMIPQEELDRIIAHDRKG